MRELGFVQVDNAATVLRDQVKQLLESDTFNVSEIAGYRSNFRLHPAHVRLVLRLDRHIVLACVIRRIQVEAPGLLCDEWGSDGMDAAIHTDA